MPVTNIGTIVVIMVYGIEKNMKRIFEFAIS
jgi:hypothetical protein